MRRIIAEHVGYRYAGMGIWVHPKGYELYGAQDTVLPDYPKSLDLMHEAVMTLPAPQRIKYRQELQYLVAPDTRPKGCGIKVMGEDSYDKWFNAPAHLRAEAFIRAIGKWEDSDRCKCGGTIISKLCSCGEAHPNFKRKP